MASKIVLASLIAVSAATEGLRPYEAPGPDDLRGPCPMLNTLANHNYLPHNGRNITAQLLSDAVTEAINFDGWVASKVGNDFLKAVHKSAFDLPELNRPGILQHIASLTRDDVTDVDSLDCAASPERIKLLLEDSSTDCLTVSSLAKTRLRVENLSAPQEMTLMDTVFAYLEASLLLGMMNDGPLPSGWSFPSADSYCAPKKKVETWLTEERFPVELGWKRSERKLGIMDFLPAMKGVFAETRLLAGKGPLWKMFVPSFLQKQETRSEL
ncbi:Cloroperoxidase [Trichoderma citrinoviride]|uniref:Cloroperoxidase n=1 Tax=Trichoderma citrinoviride TaxID=58853 RepID=A0A2T4AY27_9HYPO|nr:Cloroperoxidase [Trichoderma citrinoviride]PTB61878.1 Cloroperoxidase [Trichoderma citrinoviride]